MSSDLPDDLLGIGGGDSSGRGGDDGEDEAEELAQFVVVSIGDRELAVPVEDAKTVVDPPAELTRVPRSPPSIEGVTDLRGEITAVIDPTAHFSTGGYQPTDRKLLVFDRPNDEQSAAVRVDGVDGVVTVPASDVLEDGELDDVEGADDVLGHPLLVGIVRQERRPEVDVRDAVGMGSGEHDGESSGDEEGGAGSLVGDLESGLGRSSPLGDTSRRADRFEGEQFDVEDEDDETVETSSEEETEVVVETTPLLGVEELLLASSPTA